MTLIEQLRSWGEIPDDDGKAFHWLDLKTEEAANEIESLRKQLAAAIVACKLKHSALETLWIGTNREEWDGVAIKSFEDAIALQPDDSALKAWLGEPVAWMGHEYCVGYQHAPNDTPLYAPNGLNHGN